MRTAATGEPLPVLRQDSIIFGPLMTAAPVGAAENQRAWLFNPGE